MEQKKNWKRQALKQRQEPPGGKLGSVDPVGMASVEPLSLKGTTGEGGRGQGKGVNGSSGTVPTGWGGAGEGTGRSGTH